MPRMIDPNGCGRYVASHIMHNLVTAEQVIDLMADYTEQNAVDAEPVRHGQWHILDECANEGVYCSICHKKVYQIEYRRGYANAKMKSKFCPNCGAQMDLPDTNVGNIDGKEPDHA